MSSKTLTTHFSHAGTVTGYIDIFQIWAFASEELFKTGPFAGELFVMPPIHDDYGIVAAQHQLRSFR